MSKKLFLLFLSVFTSYSQGLWCSDLTCTSCLQGYKFQNLMCISICPTGYQLSGNNCYATSTSIYMFTAGFPLPFNAKSVLMFSSPKGVEFNDTERLSPIMTKDRGLYFAQSSQLVSNTSWILAPDYNFVICVKLINPGIIFQVTSNNQTVVEISGTKTSLTGLFTLYSAGVNKTLSFSNGYSGGWATVSLFCDQQVGKVYVSFYGRENYFDGYESRNQMKDMVYSFGGTNQTSFSGFLYDGFFCNENKYTKQISFPQIECGFNEYYFNQACIKCSPNCSEWPWCVRSTCNLCYSPDCLQCSNYSIDSCQECSAAANVSCQAGYMCLQGDIYNCTQCQTDYTNIKGVCSLTPYKYDVNNLLNPVINLKFNTFQQYYDIFQSGNNSNTYAPNNGTELDDPYPIVSRGLAFNKNRKSYLKSIVPVLLSPEFTIAYWVYIASLGLLFDKDSVKSFNCEKAIIEMNNFEEQILISSSSIGLSYFAWRFFTFGVKIESNITYLMHKCDSQSGITQVIKGYVFSDRNTTIYIGNYNQTNFLGMIYTLTIWQTYITNFTFVNQPCGLNQGLNCLFNCSQNSYYSSFENKCQDCLSNCPYGCSTYGKCSQCFIKNCTNCSSYDPDGICYAYSSNFCANSYQLSENDTCCHQSCINCYGNSYYKCYVCSPNYVLAGFACIFSCPLGFNNVLNVCVLDKTTLVSVIFNNDISIKYTSSAIPIDFTIANTSLLYPNFSIFNPIPAKNRGLYFGANSSISSPLLHLSYNISYNLWIKNNVSGIIMKRGTLSFSSTHFKINYNVFNLKKTVDSYWHVFSIEIVTDFYSACTLKIKQNGIEAYYTNTWSNFIFYTNSSQIVLGDTAGSFQGFIYKLSVYNGIFSETSITQTLSSCPINNFEENLTCYNCSESCSNGCIFNKTCNLCLDPLCEVCNDFASYNCSKCSNTSVLINGSCFCKNGTYWNQSTWKCESCPSSCFSCINQTHCDGCLGNLSLISSSCVCLDGFYLSQTGDNCLPCHAECKTCIGALPSDCLSCKENSSKDVQGYCKCHQRYFMEGGICKNCSEFCFMCTNFSYCDSCLADSGVAYENGNCRCPSGFYADLVNEKCKFCEPTCLSCNYYDGSLCTSCKSNSYLNGSNCYCNQGYYWNSTLSICSKCDSLCNDCISLLQCNNCKNNTLNINGICNCIENYYLGLNDTCLRCNDECLNCTGSTRNDCTSCKLNAALQNDKTCVCENCYFMESGNCSKCPYHCMTCLNSSYCTSCDSISYILNNECACKDGYYLDANLTTCQPCHQICKTCSGPLENNCLSCNTNSSLSGTECLCNKGHYRAFNICSECQSPCLNCSSLTNCFECKDNSTLSNGSCVCNNNYFLDVSYPASCQQCHEECLNCVGPYKSNCTQCKSFSELQIDSSCKCIIGYYLSSQSLNNLQSNSVASCLACREECEECTNLNLCVKCKAANSKIFNGLCVCEDGFFNVSNIINSDSCISCLPSCKTCNNLTSCLTCISLNSIISFENCICETGYFNTTELIYTNSCQPCHSDCLTCKSSLQCDSCKDINSLSGNYTGCICKTGFIMSSNRSCLQCAEYCSNCDNLTICTECKDPNSYPIIGSCPCNKGFYKDPINGLCAACNSSCLECENLTSCLSCKWENTELIAGTCYCLKEYYSDSQINNCSKCHPHCSKCTNSFQCETCKDLNSIPKDTEGCECKPSYFNSTNGICQKCLDECETCHNSTTCLACKDPNSELNFTLRCNCKKDFYLSNMSLCIKCDEGCNGCTSKGVCISCLDPNAHPRSGFGCECNQGYYLNTSSNICEPCLSICLTCSSSSGCDSCINEKAFGENCTECSKSCKTCSGAQEFNCESCDIAFQSGFCFNSCALGYSLVNSVCKLENPSKPALRYSFEGQGSVFYDTANGVMASVANNENKRNLQSGSGIISSYKRGAYFTGISTLKIQFEDQHLLTPNFSISAWIKPKTLNGIIIIKYQGLSIEVSNNQTILNESDSVNSTENTDESNTDTLINEMKEVLSMKIQESLIIYKIIFENTTFEVISNSSIIEGQWNHVLSETSFFDLNSITLSINNVVQETMTYEGKPFKDPVMSEMYFAGDVKFEEMFVGYYHLLEIFPEKIGLTQVNNLVLSTSCKGCSLCPATKVCIPNCEPDEFYNEVTKQCGKCPDECPTGCKNENSCNLCVDDLCIGCSSFSAGSCTECEEGYEPINWICKKCGEFTYFDNTTKRCLPCSGLCITCKTKTHCKTCKANSSLNSLKECECNFGYSGSKTCTQMTFTTKFWVNQENIVNFQFTKKLMNSLDQSFIDLLIDDKKTDFSIDTSDMMYFKLDPNSNNIKDGSVLYIKTKKTVLAIDGSILINNTFTGVLTLTKSLENKKILAKKAAVAKDTAKTGTTAGVSFTVLLSMFNFDPSSLFDFLNTAEMFYSIYLYNFEINPILSEFLLGLRLQSSFPNLFEKLIGSEYGGKVSKKLNKFGYNSELVLINIGVHIQMLALFFILALGIFLISKNNWIGKKLEGVKKSFKYGVFYRFWLQSYFEVLIACGVGIRLNKWENGVQIFDYCCCFVILVRFT